MISHNTQRKSFSTPPQQVQFYSRSGQSTEITGHSPGNDTTEHFTTKSPSLQSSQSCEVTDHSLDQSLESTEHFNLQPKQSNDLSIIFFPNLQEKVDLNLFNNAPKLLSKINISLTAAHELNSNCWTSK